MNPSVSCFPRQVQGSGFGVFTLNEFCQQGLGFMGLGFRVQGFRVYTLTSSQVHEGTHQVHIGQAVGYRVYRVYTLTSCQVHEGTHQVHIRYTLSRQQATESGNASDRSSFIVLSETKSSLTPYTCLGSVLSTTHYSICNLSLSTLQLVDLLYRCRGY